MEELERLWVIEKASSVERIIISSNSLDEFFTPFNTIRRGLSINPYGGSSLYALRSWRGVGTLDLVWARGRRPSFLLGIVVTGYRD